MVSLSNMLGTMSFVESSFIAQDTSRASYAMRHHLPSFDLLETNQWISSTIKRTDLTVGFATSSPETIPYQCICTAFQGQATKMKPLVRCYRFEDYG
jgi:hypothetical protein